MSAKSAIVNVLIYVRLTHRRANAGRNHCHTTAANRSFDCVASF